NVSLYNETNGVGILPTPTIAGVGLIPDYARMARTGFAAEGQPILLAGALPNWGTHLGQSLYARQFFDRADGAPPPVDLQFEQIVGDFVRSLIREGSVSACHDCSDGGLAISLAEMALAGNIGATINDLESGAQSRAARFFGEDQARYVLTLNTTPGSAEHEAIANRAHDLGIFMPLIGITGGQSLKLGEARAISLSELRQAHEGWFPHFMAAE
ncbi:MAG: phosphoribosylformylglycinamidine synthase II, partial [Hyphomicrobiaceae bacterium]|nr:phosphoribosylformylglycinamidine synthase II [Hyphomicrobiaceae bacterium]